jgi:hypothetical protein
MEARPAPKCLSTLHHVKNAKNTLKRESAITVHTVS